MKNQRKLALYTAVNIVRIDSIMRTFLLLMNVVAAVPVKLDRMTKHIEPLHVMCFFDDDDDRAKPSQTSMNG